MSEYSRIAIYYTAAPDNPLASAGSAWLGWDLFKAEFVEQEVVGDLSLDKLTARPRKYGFHATLKAPFRLADGFGLDDLIESYLQTVMCIVAIDEMAKSLINTKGKFRKKLFQSINSDQRFNAEILF